jgi:hypothetical protein
MGYATRAKQPIVRKDIAKGNSKCLVAQAVRRVAFADRSGEDYMIKVTDEAARNLIATLMQQAKK